MYEHWPALGRQIVVYSLRKKGRIIRQMAILAAGVCGELRIGPHNRLQYFISWTKMYGFLI